MKRIVIILCLLFFYALGFGQQKSTTKTPKPAIKVFTKNYGNAIGLRWAPTSTDVWELGNKSGYYILRLTLRSNRKKVSSVTPNVINPLPVRPYEQPQWEEMMETNKQAEIAAIALFGEGTSADFLPPGMVGSYYATLEKEGRMSYALMAADLDIEVAKAEGLYYLDENIDTTAVYLYTVALVDSTSGLDYELGSALVDVGKQKVIPKIEELEVKCHEHKAYITWKSDYLNVSFSSFDVYRSTEWEKGYKKVNKMPIVNAHSVEDPNQDKLAYVDSLPKLLEPYYYVVVGHTLFGDYGEYTAPVQAFAIPQLKAGAALSYTEIIDSTQVKLTWTYPEKYLDKLEGFVVKRAPDDNGKYVNVSGKLDKGARVFMDEEPLYNNYYYVAAFNAYGDTINSLIRFAQILDMDPPVMPTGLKGEIDSAGVVTLTWNPNPDEDILGYRIYSGNYAHEEFSRVTPGHVTDTMFVDTVSIKTLTKNVFYSIVAIDKRYNPSKFTAPVKIKRPDIIPPSPPLIKAYDAGEEGVKLIWATSSSTDVKYHEVWRKVDKGAEYELLYRGQKDSVAMVFIDTTAKAGTAYLYSVIAVDESDLKSEPAGPITLKRTKSYQKPAITNTRCMANSKKRVIKIGWEYNEYGIKHFILYRAKGENLMTIYKSIPAEEREFYDKDLSIDTRYAYRLKAVFDDGSESPFSEPLKANID